MFSIASDISADIILQYFVTISPRHSSGGKSTPGSNAALTCSCREKITEESNSSQASFSEHEYVFSGLEQIKTHPFELI